MRFRRYVALGDSFTEGVGDADPGRPNGVHGWADRCAAALAQQRARVLLREAQNIRSIATAPWLFAPGAAVVLAVMALNFLGDGLRDASDPYNK